MKCPLKLRGFDRPDKCEPQCAWAIRADGGRVVCAVTVTAAAQVDHGRWGRVNSQEIREEEAK